MSSSRNANDKAGLVKWLPWILLLVVTVAFIWLFASMKAASEQAWEPPRTTPAEQQASAPVADTPAPISSYHNAVARASQSVVNIYTTQILTSEDVPEDPLFNRFMEEPRRERALNSLGSGVIVDDKGYILTSYHVIRDADEILVALRDGRDAPARVVGTDPETDLALLHVALENLPEVELNGNGPVQVGDVVLAIGNPLGVGQTVSMGIVSATGRSHLGLNAYEDFIQTDAAINPGNSGGALINPDGALVGINTAIFSRSGGSQGIGFAIPANLARSILDELVTHGRVIRGWLGIEAQELNQELAASFGLQAPAGVIIAGVVSQGPADRAGLKPGDVLLEVDGRAVIDPRRTMSDIAAVAPGTTLTVSVARDGKPIEVELEVGERPTPQSQSQQTGSSQSAP